MAAKSTPQATKRDIEDMDESETESGKSPTKKPRKFAITDGLCKDILPPVEGKPAATFYLVDANYPLRKQIYEENLIYSEKYTFSDLCEKLQPPNIPKGEYHLVRAHPQVYMFIFSATVRACQAKLADFIIQKSIVANELILPKLTSNTVIRVNLFDLSQLRMFNTKCVLGVVNFCRQVLEKKEVTAELEEEAATWMRELETFSTSEASQSEVAVNNVLIDVLRKSIFSEDEFRVQNYSTERHVTKYGSSRQDVIIYHKEKYIKKGIVTGAIVSGTCSASEIENEDAPTMEDAERVQEHVIVGSAFEMKLTVGDDMGQLAANMLKLAGKLCQQCIEDREAPIVKEIKIYGALIEVRSSSAKPASLHICFNEQSILSIGEKMMNFAECMYRLQAVLSA